ncbi:Cell division and transport-associated protein TolA (TC 2.C.1.2.1) [Pseudomonas duriflava]|uniref:Cell division and transport-associated protein TolA (TC 2.C.1.2.1) n=1 Tax=Pseudomonas duriflava TaxID=459528 RepID=A0A562QPF6_9PSED|nr:cell envelope integrity protein TolA [Pseudomonas duriflava]TWI58607.1 Cell division and transport-associated protein TolA (TC 2.C.1.2.1) [Pseudomonas duriflava]
MHDRERSPSESYFWPVIWAVALHVIIFAALFVSWAMAPDLPQSKPIVQATLVQLKSKSPAQVQTEQKLAGEAKKTSARQYEAEQMEQRKAEQQAQAAAAAAARAAEQKATEQKKAEDARKAQQLEAAQKAAEAKAEAARAEATAKAEKAAQEKAAAEQQRKSELAKRQAEEAAQKKAAAEEAKKKAAEEAKAKAAAAAAEEAKKKAAADAAKKQAAEEAKKKAAEQAKAKAAEEAKKKAAQEAARKAAEEKKAQALAELLSDDTQRQQAMADEVGDEVAGDFDDLIRQRAAEGWTRPPGTNNGTTVILQIAMLPDGTITSVSVAKSSGNRAFDNSAMAAVKNIGRITEMQGLSPKDFSPYRSFKMTFRPEDLAL